MTDIQYKSEVKGRGGIVARVVAHSKSSHTGKEIVTFEYEAPKCILAEINTHRLFSRNAQSSRAVPIAKVIEGIRNNPVTPIYWGSNQAGMVAGEEIDAQVKVFHPEYDPEVADDGYRNKDVAWKVSAGIVADMMQAWEDAGYHKQIVNRIGEAFTMIKGVITSTEWDNFFHLRIHPAADPFIQELAKCMWEALQQSEAEVLHEGEWHTPYVEHDWGYVTDEAGFMDGSVELLYINNCRYIDAERAKKISAAATAQVSFRKLDMSDETVDRVYSRLIDDATPHGSCLEHQATPIKYYHNSEGQGAFESNVDRLHFLKGLSHVDANGNLWSGNFMGWIQNRKTLEREACWNYVVSEENV